MKEVHMKKILFLSLIIFAFACTPKKKEDKNTVKTPPKRTDTGDPSDKTVKKVQPEKLPDTMSEDQFKKSFSASVLYRNPFNLIEKFLKTDTTFFSSKVAAFAKQVFKFGLYKEIQNSYEEVKRLAISHNYKPVIKKMEVNAILTAVLTNPGSIKKSSKKVVSLIELKDPQKFKYNLNRGVFGIYEPRAWGGGKISFKGMMNYSYLKDFYIYMEGNFAFFSQEKELIKPGFKVLSKKFQKISATSPLDGHLYILKPVLTKLLKSIKKEAPGMLYAQMKPHLIKEINALSSLNFNVDTVANGDVKGEFSLDYDKNNSSYLKKMALTKKDVTDLTVYLPSNPMTFLVDKTDNTIGKKFIKTGLYRMKAFSKNKNLNKEKLKIIKFGIKNLEIYKKMMDLMGESLFSAHYKKGKYSYIRGGFSLKDPKKGKELLKLEKSLISGLNPKKIIKLSKELKKYKWFTKFLKIRVKKKKILKKQGLLITYKFKWRKIPKKYNNKTLKKIKKEIGKKLEIAFIHDGKMILFASGKKWKKELKEMMLKKGKLPKSYKNPAGQSVSQIWGINMAMLSNIIFEQWAEQNKNKAGFSSIIPKIKPAVNGDLKKIESGSWLFNTMGLKDKTFKMRLTLKKQVGQIYTVFVRALGIQNGVLQP
jgi:hypothetical protein